MEFKKNAKNPVIVIVKAPTKAADIPKSEIPPDVPAGTCLKFIIERGSDFERTPISVAQVSAAAEAKDAKYSRNQIGFGDIYQIITTSAGIKPLANT